MAYAILRVERLKTYKDVDNATLHGRRADNGTHCDPARTALNRHWLGTERVAEPVDWGLAIEDAVRDQHLHVRANGAVAAELLLAASPEFFIGADCEIDAEKLDHWVEANLAWLDQRFAEMVLAVRLDRDQSAPHLAVLVLPTYEKTRHTAAYLLIGGRCWARRALNGIVSIAARVPDITGALQSQVMGCPTDTARPTEL